MSDRTAADTDPAARGAVGAPLPDQQPVLRVRDLSVVFPPRGGAPAVRAVDGVSFDIAPGQTLGLVGESGSGKTTTGRAILQLQSASGGSVQLLGRELTTMSRGDVRRMRRHMQFVLQNPYSSLNPRMTVGQILREPLQVHRSVQGEGTQPWLRQAPQGGVGKPGSGPALSHQQMTDRVAQLLQFVGMDPAVVDRYPHAFSGGQRQRIVIARALAVNPDFVVCDEPVSALDVRTQAQIVALLHDLQQRLGLSYLFIAHDLAIVRHVAHRVAVMFSGQVVELGDAAQVFGQPGHPYTQALLDAVPVPDPQRQRARLAATPPDLEFERGAAAAGPCCFGEDHARTGTPTWHWLGEGHGVSCRFRPVSS